uniref:Si:busm1-228j01.4 n=1 Tax=Cyprinus carpio TaxID=7962 RepID=A0A8C1ZF52_CYPCA
MFLSAFFEKGKTSCICTKCLCVQVDSFEKQNNPLKFFQSSISLLFSASTHGYFGYVQTQCRVPGSIEKTEFIFSVTYNKIEYIRYNSTEDKAVGYTEFGEKWAEDYNKNKILLAQTHFVIIRSAREAKGNEKAVLVCSAYDFYPKPIKLCVVEHASSHKPMIYDWGEIRYYEFKVLIILLLHWTHLRIFFHCTDSSPSESERSKIILGAVGLLMGVFMAAGGLIYYKRKHTGWYS